MLKLLFFFISIAWTISSFSQTPIFTLTDVHDKSKGQATVIFDINNDSLLDFVTANKGKIHFVVNNGNMNFSHFGTEVVTNANGFGMHDFDSDGLMDFMIAQRPDNGGTEYDIRINNGNNTFTPMNLENESLGSARNVVFVDFDLDGYIDSYHSSSAFDTNHHGNQLHPGISGDTFGSDIIQTVLSPVIPNFWYDTLTHPTYGLVEWSNIQSKGAIVRDLDGDGKPEIIFTASRDLGFQEDTTAVEWILQQKRGIFVLQNNSTPGNISFSDVSHAALGTDAYGTTATDWSAYEAIPLDYDLDGDLDLFVGANIVSSAVFNDADIVRFYENVSTPSNITFVEKSVITGFEAFNQMSLNDRKQWNFASGIPIDYDNDGWVDLAIVNRKSGSATSFDYVHIFHNNGDKTFSEIPVGTHGLGNAGGREINYADLDKDGKLDVIVSDGSVGNYVGSDSTLIYKNTSTDANHWVEFDIKENGTWAIGTKVKALVCGTSDIIGYDEVRTDFSYRSKRYPVIHFGLGEMNCIDLEITTWNGQVYYIDSLVTDTIHLINIEQLVLSVDETHTNQLNFKIYPNPTSNKFTIQTKNIDTELVEVSIYTIQGKRIMQVKNQTEIDISNLVSGIYFVKIEIDGEIESSRIIKIE